MQPAGHPSRPPIAAEPRASERRRAAAKFDPGELVTPHPVRPMTRLSLCAVLVGLIAGLAGVAFYAASHVLQTQLLGRFAGVHIHTAHSGDRDGPHWLAQLESWIAGALDPMLGFASSPNLAWLVAIPAVGGLVVGVLAFYTKDNTGPGTDAAINAFHHQQGKLQPGTFLRKLLASTVTVGTGGAGGREGPVALMGAAIGSWLSERLGLTVRERRILLAAGIGAGIGGMFRVPLAGGLLASEALYSDADFEPDVLVPSMLASITSYCVFCLNFGWGALFPAAAQGYAFHNPLDLVAFTALTAAVVATGYLFVLTHKGLGKLLIKIDRRFRAAAGIGAAALATVGVYLAVRGMAGSDVPLLFEIMGEGYGALGAALTGTETVMWVLLAIAGGKILATALTIGSGGAAGEFAPSMVIGGCVGGAFGLLAQTLWPAAWGVPPPPSAFALLGMAGYYSAVAKAPVATVFIVTELTGSYNLLLPAGFVCTVAFLLGRGNRMFAGQVRSRRDSPAHKGDFAVDLLKDIRVRDVLGELEPHEAVEEGTSLRQILAMKNSRQSYYPVVSRDGRFTGVFSLNDVRGVLDEHAVWELLVAADIARPANVLVKPSDSLADVARHFGNTSLEELPVVDDDNPHRLLGVISRRQLNNAYVRRTVALATASRVEETRAIDAAQSRLPAITPANASAISPDSANR